MAARATEASPPRPALPPPPASLAGTEIDGALAVDARGALVVSVDVRRFFDYFLAATGEEPEAIIRARIEAEIDARLPSGAAREAKELLGRYLAYRAAARELAAGTDLEDRLAEIRALRRRILGAAAAERMFGAEEAADEIALLRRRALAETATGSAAQAERLAAIEVAMPAANRAAEAEVARPLATLRREDELHAAGAGAEEIQALRTASFGADAAERLAAMDRARDSWRARLDAFRAQRAVVEQTAGDAETMRREIGRLLDGFSPGERVRILALERIAGRPVP
jgi:lipase chaperone LimK